MFEFKSLSKVSFTQKKKKKKALSGSISAICPYPPPTEMSFLLSLQQHPFQEPHPLLYCDQILGRREGARLDIRQTRVQIPVSQKTEAFLPPSTVCAILISKWGPELGQAFRHSAASERGGCGQEAALVESPGSLTQAQAAPGSRITPTATSKHTHTSKAPN